MRWPRLLISAVFAVVMVPAVAAAQPPTPAQANKKSEALYREGIDLAKANKQEAALAKFEEARAIAPNAKATFQSARMEQALERYTVALVHYRQALIEDGLPTQERSDAVKAIDELKTKVGVIIIESPTGATVTVDGNAVADPKQPYEVAPGTHLVKATIGGESRVAEAKLEAGKVASVKLSFEAAPPPTKSNPPPPTTTTPPEQSYWTGQHIAGVGLVGLAAVGLGFSIGFGLSREHHISEQENLAPRCLQPGSATCNDFDDHGSSADTARVLTFVSAGVAVAATAGAVILLWPRSSATTTGFRSTRIVPAGAGAAVIGRF